MSICKFEKYRSVNEYYLNVPYKYITNYDGANMNPTYKVFSREDALNAWAEKNPEDYKIFDETFCTSDTKLREIHEEIGQHIEEYIDKLEEKNELKNCDKTLCIVDFFGKHLALVAWRNNNTCTMGMPKLCRLKNKNNHVYLIYKGKEIRIDEHTGWVF